MMCACLMTMVVLAAGDHLLDDGDIESLNLSINLLANSVVVVVDSVVYRLVVDGNAVVGADVVVVVVVVVVDDEEDDASREALVTASVAIRAVV